MSVDNHLEARRKKLEKQIKNDGILFEMPKVLHSKEGAFEIIKKIGSYKSCEPFFSLVTFLCKKPFSKEPFSDDDLVPYSVEYSKQIVYLPIVDGKLMLRHYSSTPLGYWNYWIPSIITNLPENLNMQKYDDLPENQIIPALTEIDELTFRNKISDSIEIIPLGKSAKDKGASASINPFYLVKLSKVEFQHEGKNGRDHSWKLFSVDEICKKLLDPNANPWEHKCHTMFNLLRLHLEAGSFTLSD